MTNLEFAICEAENSGEITMSDRDFLLDYISEKFSNPIASVKSKLNAKKEMNSAKAAMRKGIAAETPKDQIKGLTAEKNARLDNLYFRAAYNIALYHEALKKIYSMSVSDAADDEAASGSKNTKVVSQILTNNLTKANERIKAQLAALETEEQNITKGTAALIKHIREAAAGKLQTTISNLASAFKNAIKAGWAWAKTHFGKILPHIHKKNLSKDQQEKLEDAEEKVAETPEAASDAKGGDAKAEVTPESVRMDIYDAELNGQITVEERVALINELDERLASYQESYEDPEDAFADLL